MDGGAAGKVQKPAKSFARKKLWGDIMDSLIDKFKQ
jgi:hypothetical protein